MISFFFIFFLQAGQTGPLQLDLLFLIPKDHLYYTAKKGIVKDKLTGVRACGILDNSLFRWLGCKVIGEEY